MTLSNQTAPLVIAEVGKAWVQSNQGLFLWPQLPVCRVPSLRGGWNGSVTFPLPKLETFLSSNLADWSPGQSRPQARKVKEDSFTISSESKAPLSIGYPDGLTGPQRLLWLADRIPALYSEMWIGMDRKLATFLASSANFGTAKTFTGGPLNTPANWATQNPINDIQTQTQGVRVYNDGVNFKYVCIMDRFVADVMRQHPAYTGAAYTNGSSAVSGAGVPAILPDEAFVAKLKSLHGFDEVYIGRSAANVAVTGATADIKSTTDRVLWMGVVPRQKTFDLRVPQLAQYPDGAFTLALGQDPMVEENPARREGVVFVDASVEFQWNKIRGESFGVWWDPTTIFA